MISILNGGSRKELCPRSKLPALTAFRVIPIRTKYPRALSSCIMHTPAVEATPPLTVSSILRTLPKGGCRSSFSPSPYGPVASLSPSLPDRRVFRVILLCCDSIVAPTAYTVSMLRMLAFLPHARKHTSAYEARAEIPGQYTHPHTCTPIQTYPSARGARGVYADTPST